MLGLHHALPTQLDRAWLELDLLRDNLCDRKNLFITVCDHVQYRPYPLHMLVPPE